MAVSAITACLTAGDQLFDIEVVDVLAFADLTPHGVRAFSRRHAATCDLPRATFRVRFHVSSAAGVVLATSELTKIVSYIGIVLF